MTWMGFCLSGARVLQADVSDRFIKARLLGDVDGNGAVDSADSAQVLKYAAEAQELDDVQNKAADVNKDGAADSTDAAAILEQAAGF